MTYRGHVKNGQVVLDEPIELPDGVEVRVNPVSAATDELENSEIPSLYEQLEPLVGKAKGLPVDASVNLDHYLYGTRDRA